jgi:chemoreceptor-like protein with four helix bundle sensory module
VQRLQNLSIRGKLGAGFGLVLALTVTLGSVMLSELSTVNAGGRYLGDVALVRATSIGQVEGSAIDLRRAQLKYVLDPHTAAGAKA